jgi:endoglucanase
MEQGAVAWVWGVQMIGRRTVIRSSALSVGLSAADSALGAQYRPASSDLENKYSDWKLFRERFIAPEGRVVDTGNGGCSHSEGQGYGMLLAVAHDDQPTFDQLFSWTQRQLARPGDSLHAWRYQPGAVNPVPDTNNATDGDLVIALALARAAVRWRRQDTWQLAANIGRDILNKLVRDIGGRTVLLPAAYGFEKPDGLVVNLSYYVFPALDVLTQLVPSPVWDKLRRDGEQLIADARFGHWNLPPDWLFISRSDFGLAPAPGWPPRFSYDAIRVPLHTAWSGVDGGDIATSVQRFWSSHAAMVPGWVDVNTGETARYGANAGQMAVAMLSARCCAGGSERPAKRMPSVRDAQDYYAAALVMLARLALSEARIV